MTKRFLIIFAVILLSSGSSIAQDRKFKAGEFVETGGGMSVKIMRCRGTGDNEECEVQYYRGETPESTPRWENALLLRLAEERVLNSKRQNAPAAADDAPIEGPTQVTATIQTAPTTECSFDVPTADSSKTARPSEHLFKRKIYDNYNIIANGTMSAPLRVGVTFINFEMLAPFTNVVRVVPGVGAQRINDAAPPNTTIYPVSSKHIVCEEYRDSVLRKRVENKYACFKNRDGEWTCGADGIPKVTQLQ
jgi:hypothetical protein